MKSQSNENNWKLVTATDELHDFNDMAMENHSSPEAVILEFKRKLKTKGIYSLLGLEKTFEIIDIDKSGVIEFEEFREALKLFRIFLTQDEAKEVFYVFDENGNGVIELVEFIERMKGSINEKRKNLILSAFKKISNQTSGFGLTVDSLKLSFNANGHPDVLSSKKSAKEVEIEFSNYWGSGDGIVQQEAFFKFYESMSAMIEEDDYFREMMKGCWRLPNNLH